MTETPNRMKMGKVHETVIALGFVSLLMDMSSESIHALLPLFMVEVLGLTALAVGLLDGMAEAVPFLIKPFSGWLSDRVRNRKRLTVVGYGLAALTKPLFAIAGGLGMIVFARLLDRVGKGVRGAPRDALIADVTASDLRGQAFGLRQSMDTLGAVLGPLLAAFLIGWWLGDYRAAFWMASIPAAIALLVLVLGVREPEHAKGEQADSPEPGRSNFSPNFWGITALAGAMALARPSEAFLLLRAQSVGWTSSEIPLLLALLNSVYALTAYPVGRYFDRLGERNLLTASLGCLGLALFLLQSASSSWTLWAAAIAWGLHLGSSQGVLAALISLHSPSEKRGTAFGVYAACVGGAFVANGAVVGALWSRVDPESALGFCLGMTLFAAAIQWRLHRRLAE